MIIIILIYGEASLYKFVEDILSVANKLAKNKSIIIKFHETERTLCS
jgi:hypothetical protein